jgi:signal peptidase II
LTTIGLSCVVGGGIANLYDRFLYGSVTDFLFMDFNFARTGIFNLADLSVTTGMVLILISTFKEKNRKSKPLP